MGALFSCASNRNKVVPSGQSNKSRTQKRGSKKNTTKLLVSSATEKNTLLFISTENMAVRAEDELKPDRFRPRNPSPPVAMTLPKDDVVESGLLDESSIGLNQVEEATWNKQQQQRKIDDHANVCELVENYADGNPLTNNRSEHEKVDAEKLSKGDSGKIEMDLNEKVIEEQNSCMPYMMRGQRCRTSNSSNAQFDNERDEFTDSYFETMDKLLKSKHCKWNRSDSFLSSESWNRDFQIGFKPKPECNPIAMASYNRELESIGSIDAGSFMPLSGGSIRRLKGIDTRPNAESPFLVNEEDDTSSNHERRFTKDSIYAWSTSTPDPRTTETPIDRSPEASPCTPTTLQTSYYKNFMDSYERKMVSLDELINDDDFCNETTDTDISFSSFSAEHEKIGNVRHIKVRPAKNRWSYVINSTVQCKHGKIKSACTLCTRPKGRHGREFKEAEERRQRQLEEKRIIFK